MISRKNRIRKAKVLTMACLALVAAAVLTTGTALAETRKFVVMLAHSPKAFSGALPPGGLHDKEEIRKDYFDTTFDNGIDSFAEYWEEISYGDVVVTGDVKGWVQLPWPFEPNSPFDITNRATPDDYIDLDRVAISVCTNPVPSSYTYGAGESFCDCTTFGDSTTDITPDKCGALIIIDLIGEPMPRVVEPLRGIGLPDIFLVGVSVWTPGERFVDLDGDMRWDGIDEKNDMMCHDPGGCRNVCSAMICEDASRYCLTEADCPPGIGCKRGSLNHCEGSDTICSDTNPCIGGTRCVLANTPCDGDDDCTGGETCGDRGRCGFLVCADGSDYCFTSDDCPPNIACTVGSLTGAASCDPLEPDVCGLVEECIPPGPRGCDTPGCGDLFMPCMDWDDNGQCNNPGGEDPRTEDGCTPMNFIPCVTNADCPNGICLTRESLGQSFSFCDSATPKFCTSDAECFNGACVTEVEVEEIVIQLPEGKAICGRSDLCFHPDPNDPDIELDDCCDADLDTDQLALCKVDDGVVLCTLYPDDEDCNPLPEGIACGTPQLCCEFADFDEDGNVNTVEPFEDYMIRWEPSGSTVGSTWVPVDREYVKNNYAGDVTRLLARTGNGYYDSPDLFIDFVDENNNAVSTKMMQDAGVNQFAWATPKPGSRYATGPPNFHVNWYDSFWQTRYGTTAPPWPGGASSTPPANTPIMRPFDQAQPNPPHTRPDENGDLRWFRANRGGWSGFGRGTGDGNGHNIEFDVGGVDFDSDILPDAEFGYYDGWVEHDDLASSKYHRMGDKRLGEVMSPAHDRVTVPGTDDGQGQDAEYDAIFGVDLGRNNPDLIPTKDGFCVAAGPGAVAVHGDSGYDAGDIMILEWLTWRRDGQSSTVALAWESENGAYHPYATPAATQHLFPPGRCSSSTRVVCLTNRDCPSGEACNRPRTAIGFRDYNLDGMIDQGEVRPALSANYSVDVDPATPDNDGTHTNYPFNRRRMLEDIVESLDIGLDFNNFVDADNLVSGIVLVPPQAYTDINRFPLAPSYFPIFTMDTGSTKPRFHDLVICQDCRDFPAAIAYSAHEYLHTWEGYPDLYDYGVFDEAPAEINCPIGRWDIMSRFGGLVHPNPALKERSGWIKTVDLKSVLTPGVETILTLPPAELVRDDSYYFLENSERTGERFYFWSAGSGFDSRQPGPGMVILRTTNASANQEALAQQQRTDPYNFLIVQADGNGDLEACEAGGNPGDAGDVWPGSTGATQFNFTTTPSSSWPTETRWTGLNITDIQPDPDGSVVLSLSWVPTNIPSLQFIDPPGGESVASIYQVRYDVTDIFGGTEISLYYADNEDELPNPATATFVNSRSKIIPGTARQSMDWNISGVADGRYFVFAKLVPGPTPDGTERKFTQPNASRNNQGDGTLTVLNVDVSSSISSTARSETWIVECVDPNGLDWRVNSSISQPRPDDPGDDSFGHATTGVAFNSDGGEVRFIIQVGTEPFQLGDTFNFTTTGITQYSQSVTIIDSRIRATPVAVIDPLSALSGEPPLTVTLDARSSSDPEGLPLTFAWDFGDGTNGSGPQVIHTFVQGGTFTVVLRATNPNGQFGTTQVDVNVLNNSPTAKISADPTNGPAPLTVQFDSAGSSDLETAIGDLIYQWDFGDGLTANSQGEPGVFQIPPPHFYSRRADGTICTSDDPCLFNALLTVTDTGGKSSTDTIAILVGNSSPIPNVTVSPTSGTSPLTVSFNASLSSDPDGDDIEIIWVFGDGEVSPRIPVGTVTHDYETGTYQPSATLFDVRNGVDRGGVSLWTGPSITVTALQEGSSDPIADFELDPEPPYEIGQEFTVKSTSRDRPNPATTLTHVWNFGDGSPEISGLEREVTHAYTTAPAAGQSGFTISLVVTDPEGNFGRRTQLVQVVQELPDDDGGDDADDELENQRPTAVFVINTNGSPVAVGSLVQFDASGSRDPEDGVLRYRWDFGDGSRAEAGFGNTYVTRTHTYTEPGVYTVLLTVSDASNASADAMQQITVLSAAGNRPPVPILVDGPRVGAAPFTVQLDGRLSFDPDNDPLRFIWEFSDETGEIETIEENDGFITRTFDVVGIYKVVMKVDDGKVADDELPFVADEIRVTSPVVLPDPVDPGLGVPGDGPPAGSHAQRPPSVPCGFGMLTGLFVSLFGLSVMRLHRRRGVLRP